MLGTLNGKIITFPRIVYAMAKRNDLPFSSYLTYLTPKGKSPITSEVTILTLLNHYYQLKKIAFRF